MNEYSINIFSVDYLKEVLELEKQCTNILWDEDFQVYYPTPCALDENSIREIMKRGKTSSKDYKNTSSTRGYVILKDNIIVSYFIYEISEKTLKILVFRISNKNVNKNDVLGIIVTFLEDKCKAASCDRIVFYISEYTDIKTIGFFQNNKFACFPPKNEDVHWEAHKCLPAK